MTTPQKKSNQANIKAKEPEKHGLKDRIIKTKNSEYQKFNSAIIKTKKTEYHKLNFAIIKTRNVEYLNSTLQVSRPKKDKYKTCQHQSVALPAHEYIVYKLSLLLRSVGHRVTTQFKMNEF